ncbi:progestin/adipoQ receptor family protein [Microdochium bolleyi]|uniref:Progestin/adipoQ receptor family protein n=1 Tax=Microdochium bolleyi TaxID=196109 RepID=A0A136JE48_9PEZI|nr:progestin/adipoQ receptor family protein [Microdochium bolleyi]
MDFTSANMSYASSYTKKDCSEQQQQQDGQSLLLPSLAAASGNDTQDAQPRQRRPTSQLAAGRRKSIVNHFMDGEEALLLKMDQFLTELERRLQHFENLSDYSIDASVARTFATLQAVRERCSQVSGEFMGAGRKRLQVMVETLDARYHDAMAAAESMNEKARVGIELLDDMLDDFETRAVKMRDQGIANATDAAESFMDEGRKVMDKGLERARGVVNEGFEQARHAKESLEDTVQKAIARARERGHLTYNELPIPWRVNPHIRSGYRFRETTLGCVRSIFGVSNETVNIWTHALGLVIVLAIAFYFYPTSADFALYTKTDMFIAGVFLFAACKCLICSTVWHTMSCHADQGLMECFACVDYTGISLLIAASIMTTEYTVFYCEPVSRWSYITATMVLGIIGVILPWNPRFNQQNMAWVRVAFFVGLGATGFLPIFQVIYTRGFQWALDFYSDSNLLKSLTVYVIGAIIYASKVPERWYPGAFDYFGNAHNLWHVAVLGGIVYHFLAMQQHFSGAFQRALEGCPAY